MGSTSDYPPTSSILQSQHTDELILEPRHRIFLSHSRHQKDFVEQLCADLERAHQSAFDDRRSHSLPSSEENVRQLILQASRQCKLVVAVLSHEFFESKWPMVELATFVKSKVKILPVFYKVTPGDCSNEQNVARWLSKWQAFNAEDRTIDTQKWREALRQLGGVNGEVFDHSMSEAEYRKKIVSTICLIIGPDIQYDDSYVQGRDRMSEIIERRFKEAHGACRTMRGSTVIGMYGIGGTGKTTLCRSLCKFYSSDYSGKVSHVELPTDCTGGGILEAWKKALRDVTDVNEDEVINAVTDPYQQAEFILKQRLPRHTVFLALDNVWDKSLVFVSRLLEARCAHESKILVVARSLEVLENLLPGCVRGVCLMPSPDIEKEEAVNALMYYSGLKFPHVSEEELNFFSIIVETCLLNKGVDGAMYHYHPLALKALGDHLRRMNGGMAVWKKILVDRPIFRCLETENEQILTIIRSSYDELPSDIHKRIFLDVALFKPLGIENVRETCDWLRTMYDDDPQCVEDVANSLNVLRSYSLVQFKDSDPKIRMHELYREFAEWEVKNGSSSWCAAMRARKNASAKKERGHLKRIAVALRRFELAPRINVCKSWPRLMLCCGRS